MFAHTRVHPAKGAFFSNPHTHPRSAEFYSSGQPVFKVIVRELREKEESIYWAWWSEKDQEFMFVYPFKGLVEMCFPYGSKCEEERGRGKLMNVVVERDGE